MDAVSYSLASKQAQRIEKFIENPDSTSGIVTVPKTIASGETVTVPAGRVAVLPNVVVDGTLNIDGEVFIPSGSSVDFSNGIKIDGNNIALSIPTSYHLLQGNLSVSNEVITNGFSTTLYTGNGTTQSINTGIDMFTQHGNDVSETFGGLSWIKGRNDATSHQFVDTVRGATKAVISDTTGAETTDATRLNLFNNNGFTIGSNTGVNASTKLYTSWNFQTTHRRTGVTNHGKAYTEHYNPFTGFTIIKYEGSGLSGHEIPHHLGRKLGFRVIKNLSVVNDWISEYDDNGYLKLNLTDSYNTAYKNTSNDDAYVINNGISNWNTSPNQYIMYGWANSYLDETNKLIGNYEVGVYQGTGVAGNKVTTRGKPAWIMIKRLDSIADWFIIDNMRGDNSLLANTPGTENSSPTAGDYIDFVQDGFVTKTLTSQINALGGQYLYMVVYDNDSGSGKSKYQRATDTSNVQINNALIPLAHGVDSNGSKNSIVVANETITGLTYTQGKNYLYRTDTGYGVKPYEPRMLSSELVRRFAGEQPDYYDVNKNKWFSTDAGSELVVNGTFDSNTTGWTALNSTLSIVNNTLRVTTTGSFGGAYQTFTNLVVGKTYRYKLIGSLVTSNQFIIRVGVPPFASYDYQSAWQTVSGSVYIDFVALYTTMAIEFVFGSTTGVTGSIDNVTCFPVDITPTTEIVESRNYLNHLVHADQNGQVTYVEELLKIEYKNVIKANEYQGRNACTAKAIFDRTTYKLSGLYKIGGAINIGTSSTDFIFEEEMDSIDYEVAIDCSFSAFTSNAMTPYSSNKTTRGFRVQHYSTAGGGSNPSMVSIIVLGGKN